MKRLVVLIIVMSSLIGWHKGNAQVAVGISVGIAPPAIPVYVQPPCPVVGYLWVPGYWAWDPDAADYYWVPGYWAAPPEIGFLWTPGYWGWEGGHYWWHGGYWGPHVGFYGGINYGCGYWGTGFCGGRWEGGRFMYNTAAWRVGGGFHNTYVDRTVIVNNTNRTSFNGPGGITRQPTVEERSYMNEHHTQPTTQQMSHERGASMNRNQFASRNGGNPHTMARSSVGGQRFNASGNAMHSVQRANGNQRAFQQNRGMQAQQHNNFQRGNMQAGRMQQGSPGRAPQGGGRGFSGGGGGGRNHR